MELVALIPAAGKGSRLGRSSGSKEAITLEEAVEIYTLQGARAMKMDDRIGSLAPGKLADFIVLEKNIFEIPIDDVADTTIRQTFFEGKLVYEGTP